MPNEQNNHSEYAFHLKLLSLSNNVINSSLVSGDLPESMNGLSKEYTSTCLIRAGAAGRANIQPINSESQMKFPSFQRIKL